MIVNEIIINYTNEYRKILTDNEYEYLCNRSYKISNFYMNSKLRKFKELDKKKKLKVKILNISILLRTYKSKVNQLLLKPFITQVEFLKYFI